MRKSFILAGLALFLSLPLYSQNTKGDQPVNNKGKVRETRFKTRSKQGDRSKTKDIAGRRLRTKNQSSAGRAVINYKPPRSVKAGRKDRGDRAARPTGPTYGTPPRDSQKASRFGRVQVRSSTGRTRNVYPQSGRYVNNTSTRQRNGQKPERTPRVNVRSATGKTINVYTQSWRYVHNQSKPRVTRERAGKPVGGYKPRSSSAKVKRVYPQSGRFVHNTSRQTKTRQHVQSNRPQIVRLQRLQGDPDPGKRKVVPRSATRAHVGKRSINPYANFHRKKRKPEQARTTDLAGQPLRRKNFESTKPEIVPQTYKPYYNRRRVGDRPYKGEAAGRHVSATRTKPKAWRGDIAGRRIRGKNHETRRRPIGNITGIKTRNTKPDFGDKADRKLKGGGYKSASRASEKRAGRSALTPRAPGIGALGIGKYRGTLKARRPGQGGGSRSGKLWNNKGVPISVRGPSSGAARAGGYPGNIKRFSRSPGFSNQGEEYTGAFKAGRRQKGGGSISGKLWNNRQSPIPVRTPSSGAAKAGGYPGNIKRFSRSPGFSNQGEEYTGAFKAGRRQKGGGSISGKLWNNRQSPIPVRTPSSGAAKAGGYPGNIKRFSRSPGFSNQGEEFTGTIKARRRQKGGGSVSGKLWNNRQSPIAVRTPSSGAARAGGYSGTIKARRPEKGGGSISGKLWNNRETAIAVRTPSTGAARAGGYSGNIKAKRPEKGGGSISGKLWNNRETPIAVRTPSTGAARAGGYSGNIKIKRSEKGGPSMSARRPAAYTGNKRDFGKSHFDQGEEFTGTTRLSSFRKNYVRNKNAAEEALMKARPKKVVSQAGNYTGNRRDFGKSHFDQGEEFTGTTKLSTFRKNYVRNKNSADEALKKARPGKAVARTGNFQGNVRMRKFELMELFERKQFHPDKNFVRNNKNNVDEERSFMTNVKLLWARLFRKNETQPDHLKDKDKDRKPRYDKGEQGLWYD